jgi:hypothetical protein
VRTGLSGSVADDEMVAVCGAGPGCVRRVCVWRRRHDDDHDRDDHDRDDRDDHDHDVTAGGT